MKIADIEQQLIQAGCKSVHIERFWRNWYSGKPLNRSKVRLPAAAEAILPQMEEYLANQLTAQEKAESDIRYRLKGMVRPNISRCRAMTRTFCKT